MKTRLNEKRVLLILRLYVLPPSYTICTHSLFMTLFYCYSATRLLYGCDDGVPDGLKLVKTHQVQNYRESVFDNYTVLCYTFYGSFWLGRHFEWSKKYIIRSAIQILCYGRYFSTCSIIQIKEIWFVVIPLHISYTEIWKELSHQKFYDITCIKQNWNSNSFKLLYT